MQYQIEQNWGKSCKIWDYFESDLDEDSVKQQAINIVKEQQEKRLERKKWNFFANTDPSKPTIIIREYPLKKNGLIIKTKWR